MDLFTHDTNHKVTLFVMKHHSTPAGGLNAFHINWNRWSHFYPFPPSTMTILLRLVSLLNVFHGRVMLIAPLWPAQPWCITLKCCCPHPIPLGAKCREQANIEQLGRSLKLHPWIFFSTHP